MASAFDDGLLGLLGSRAAIGVRGPPDWDAFVAPIDVVIEGENLTEQLPPEPVLAFGQALDRIGSALAAGRDVGQVDFFNSPWSLVARPHAGSSVLVTVATPWRRAQAEQRFLLDADELIDEVRRFVRDLAARIGRACGEAGWPQLVHPLSPPPEGKAETAGADPPRCDADRAPAATDRGDALTGPAPRSSRPSSLRSVPSTARSGSRGVVPAAALPLSDVGEVCHVQMEWSAELPLTGRPAVDAWPTAHGWLVRAGAALGMLDGAGRQRWSLPGPLLASHHLVVSDELVLMPLPNARARDGAARWVSWRRLADGAELLRAAPLDRGFARLRAIEGSQAAAAVGPGSVAVVHPDGSVARVEVRVRRPRFASVGDALIVTDAGGAASVSCWRVSELRPRWAWSADADSVQTSVWGDRVLVLAAWNRGLRCVAVLLDATTGEPIARDEVAGCPVASGALADGRPWRAVADSDHISFLLPAADGARTERHVWLQRDAQTGRPLRVSAGSLLVVAGGGVVQALDPLRAQGCAWRLGLRVDPSAMNALTHADRPVLLPIPSAGALHWVLPATGRILATLPRRDAGIVAGFASPRGDLLLAEHAGPQTLLRFASATRLLRLVRGGQP